MQETNANGPTTEKWKKKSGLVGLATSAPFPGALPLHDSEIPSQSTATNQKFTSSSNNLDYSISEASEEEEIQMGKEVAAIFKDKGVHPVLIFGSKGSGKTSLIASLLKYMRDRPEAAASIELAEELFPENDPKWTRRIEWAQNVFFKTGFDFIVDRVAPPSTLESLPFFIPVKVTLQNGTFSYFAFLEGKGEWYMPDYDAQVPFRKFKGFIQGLLQSFSNTSTVLYIAPFVTEDKDEGPNTKGLRLSDVGLLGAISEYALIRKAMFHQDHHLFLVTKWDVCCDTIASEKFIEPDADEIQNVLRERYQLAWTKYLNLSLPGENKSYSWYCSGVMDGRTVSTPAAEDSDRIAQFPRKLWDSLYQNATKKVLYEDVQPRELGFLDKLLRLLRR